MTGQCSKIHKQRFFFYISDFSRAPIKTKEAYITRAPSQGEIEQKFQIFPMTKSTYTLPV